jgi:ABC-2 type transport system permease protein
MYGLAGAVIGVAYALRAIGDVGGSGLSWLSPIGWYQAMHAFSGLRWWPALLLLAGSAAAVVAAYRLFDRRDVGSGLLAARPGPARAGPGLASALGLPWRLQRGAVLAWTLGLLLTGLAYGAIGNDVGDLMGDSQASRDLFAQGGADLVDGFYATACLMLGLLTCGFAISSALRPRTEEDDGRVEGLLATGLSRRRWLLGHTAVTVLGTVAVLVGAAVGLGVGYALVTGDAGSAARLAWPVLQYVPAALLLSAVARLLHGLSPRAATLAWLPLVVAVVVMFFGELLRLPQWLQDLSPFEHLALVPAQDFRWAPFVVLAVLATLVSLAGQLAFRRRDIR